jgi:hypothetical protein
LDTCEKVEAFDFATNMSERFSIVGTEVWKNEEYFVLRDSKFPEDSEESHVFLPVNIVLEVDATRILEVLNGDKKQIPMHGVTRIVGYYSRVHNWNKSKIGELRDRQNGQYGTGKHDKVFHEEALAVCDNM